MDVPALSEESIGKLTQLLRKWRLEFLMSQFIDEKIDEEVLEMIDLSHINILLHKYPMGVQIRFAHHLDNWRKSIGKPLKAVTFDEFTTTISPKESYGSSCGESRTSSQASTIAMVRNDSHSDITILSYNPSDNTDSDVASIQYASTENLSTTSVPKRIHPTKLQSRAKVDLEEILLNSPPNGPDLIQLYRKQKHFTPLDRKRLISTIVNYYLECKITLDLETSYDLENAIVIMFPRESLQMYRNSRQGKIFMRYTREMAKEEESEKMRDEGCPDDNGNFGADISFELREDGEGEESMSHIDHDVLIQIVNEGQKKFIKIRAPFLYHSFLTTACEMFHITKVSDYCLFFTGCEIEEDRFKNLVMEFYKSPTFTLELVAKSKTVDTEVIANNLPDVNYIRNIPCLRPLAKIYDNDKPLENMHRTIIAKTIIDECLKFNPQRILKRPDFLTLADNICQAFHTEVQSTYFVPCHNAKPARGKLWSAYTNKRSLLKAAGLLSRRACRKRKLSLSSDENDDEEHPAKKFITESPEFSANTHLDGDALAGRWQETHKCRRQELLKGEMSAQDYMTKYSILQNIRGMDLMELDVNKMYPNRANMDNWLTLYLKVVERVRKVRKFKHVPKIIENIEASKDTRYRASLALNLLIYIFPHTGHYSKPEIQNRFLKEYKSMDDLMNDGQPGDLQIRFVNQSQKIVYADFTVCGCTFKFVDLLEALAHCFNYVMALNLEYPKLCLRLWQFVQLGIFHIDIERAKMPHVESAINDLLYVQKD